MRTQMQHQTSQTLYNHWNAVRASRIAPRRFEIEPSAIAGILPQAFVLERERRGTYRFRLAGTRICEQFGREFRGTNFIDLWPEANRFTVEQNLGLVGHGAAALFNVTAEARGWGKVPFEMLILPLVHTHGQVDRFVGSLAALSDPNWLGYETLAMTAIGHSDLIWPDGRPFSVLEPTVRDAPFLPHVRNARIVRHDRRQFRVYDGGLTKPTTDET